MSYSAVGNWFTDFFLGPAVSVRTAGSTVAETIQSTVCRIEASDAYQNLTALVQDALRKRGAKVTVTGRWDTATCAAWWKVMREPVTPEAIRRLVPDVAAVCSQMTVDVTCPNPGKPRLFLAAGAVTLGAVVVVYLRRRRG